MKLIMEGWRKFLKEAEEEDFLRTDLQGQGTPTFDMDTQLDKEYTQFVQWLGGNIQDPKTQALIGAGLKDGDPADDKFGFEDIPIPVIDLIPTQNEIDINKSLAYPLLKDPTEFISKVSSNGPFTVVEPIVTFNGKYVIDGHHRWSTVYACNKNAQINATNITIQGIDPLDALKAVQMAIGLQAKKVPMQSVEGTNLLSIDENQLKAWLAKNVQVQGELVRVIMAAPEVLAKLKAAAGKETQEAPELADVVMKEFAQMAAALDAPAIVETYLPAYIWSNVASMRQTSQPTPGAGPRDFMPQTGGVNWKEPLAKGEVDIKPPHGTDKAAE